MSKYCKNCGAPLKPDVKFCGACGSAAVASSVPTQTVPDTPVPNGIKNGVAKKRRSPPIKLPRTSALNPVPTF